MAALPAWRSPSLPIRIGISSCLLGEEVRLIADFARGLVPLIVPITLINHYVTRFGIAYMADQIYLSPDPKELVLRNHT